MLGTGLVWSWQAPPLEILSWSPAKVEPSLFLHLQSGSTAVPSQEAVRIQRHCSKASWAEYLTQRKRNKSCLSLFGSWVPYPGCGSRSHRRKAFLFQRRCPTLSHIPSDTGRLPWDPVPEVATSPRWAQEGGRLGVNSSVGGGSPTPPDRFGSRKKAVPALKEALTHPPGPTADTLL